MTTHGMRQSPEYQAWINMRRRCANPSHKHFARYGGRGIFVCERWQSFENFYADVGPRPSSRHMLERRNNELGYSPDNCCWATTVEQAINRSSTRMLTHLGKTQCLTHWARELGFDHRTIEKRLRRGLSVGEALSPASYLRSKMLTLDGRIQSLPEWSRELAINQRTLWGRIKKGWTDEDVLLTPVVDTRFRPGDRHVPGR